jgi:hypothetical protein
MPRPPSSDTASQCTNEPINDTRDTFENEKKKMTMTRREKRGMTCPRRGKWERQAYLYDRNF